MKFTSKLVSSISDFLSPVKDYNLSDTQSFQIRKLNQPSRCLILQFKGKIHITLFGLSGGGGGGGGQNGSHEGFC